MLIAAIAGTRIQLGIVSILAKRPTIGMFISSSMKLAMNIDAIRPQTRSG